MHLPKFGSITTDCLVDRALPILIALICGLIYCTEQVGGIKWIGIYHLRKSSEYPSDTVAFPFSSRECDIARTHLGFLPRQAKFCSHARMGFAMLPVLRAARAVGFHCPDTFSDRRWNCSSVAELPKVSPELRLGTREKAVVHAYAAAALIFEIGRYCALNKIRYCSCGSGTSELASGTETMSQRPPFSNPTLAAAGAAAFKTRAKRQMDADAFKHIQDVITFNGWGSDVRVTKRPSVMGEGNAQLDSSLKYFWSGCPDNIETAQQYVAEFLGFDEKRLLMNDFPQKHSQQLLQQQQSYQQEPSPDARSFRFYSKPSGNLYGPNTYRGQRAKRSVGGRLSSSRNRRSRGNRRRNRNAQVMKLTNKHNYMAGVWMMITEQKRFCKCHGLSGSCTQKICVRQLQRIDTPVIKSAIKTRYLAAKKVSRVMQGRLLASVFKDTEFVDEFVELDDLVFSEHSPDYCEPDHARGSLGTHGRMCALNGTDDGSCKNMCCGRGQRSVTKQTFERCNCVMLPNFSVRCQTCLREDVKYTCL